MFRNGGNRRTTISGQPKSCSGTVAIPEWARPLTARSMNQRVLCGFTTTAASMISSGLAATCRKARRFQVAQRKNRDAGRLEQSTETRGRVWLVDTAVCRTKDVNRSRKSARNAVAALISTELTAARCTKKKVVETTVPSWAAFCCRTRFPG